MVLDCWMVCFLMGKTIWASEDFVDDGVYQRMGSYFGARKTQINGITNKTPIFLDGGQAETVFQLRLTCKVMLRMTTVDNAYSAFWSSLALP